MHLTTVLYVCTSQGEKNVQPYHSSNLGPSDYPAMLYQLKNLATIATVSPANFFFFFWISLSSFGQLRDLFSYCVMLSGVVLEPQCLPNVIKGQKCTAIPGLEPWDPQVIIVTYRPSFPAATV